MGVTPGYNSLTSSIPAYVTGTAGKMYDYPNQDLSALPVGANVLSYSASFVSYILFMPPGTGSSWIPVESVVWSFSVSAAVNTNANTVAQVPWILNSSSPPAETIGSLILEMGASVLEVPWNYALVTGTWVAGP
jgi:hypothetical protein